MRQIAQLLARGFTITQLHVNGWLPARCDSEGVVIKIVERVIEIGIEVSLRIPIVVPR